MGGYFVWEATSDRPLLLVGGGSGLVPLMSIVRHHEAVGASADARLLLSARTLEDVLYREELERLRDGADAVTVHLTLTRDTPPAEWNGFVAAHRPRDAGGGGTRTRPSARACTCAARRRSWRRPRSCSWGWATTRRRSTPNASDPQEDEMHTDGNAIARTARGDLRRGDDGGARAAASPAGETHAIGSHRLYTGAGYVLRCPNCGDMAAVIVNRPGDYRVSLMGAWSVQLGA